MLYLNKKDPEKGWGKRGKREKERRIEVVKFGEMTIIRERIMTLVK